MGAPSNSWRALAGFLGIAAGVALLFALVSMVTLRPRDALAWVRVPDLAADLRVDAGLQTKPLKETVVAAVLQDLALDGATGSRLAVAPAPAATPQFAIRWAGELVNKSKNNGNGGRCSQTTVTGTGGFTTNGVGGSVSYQWVRVDNQGKRTIGASGTIQVAAGDTNLHGVTSDTFTPVHSGSDQLVFLSPAYSVPAQSWNCVG